MLWGLRGDDTGCSRKKERKEVLMSITFLVVVRIAKPHLDDFYRDGVIFISVRNPILFQRCGRRQGGL